MIICLLLIGLLGRTYYISYTSGDKYNKKVLSQLDYDSTIIPFRRGDIVDKNGTILATSVDVYNLILDCAVLNNKTNEGRVNSTITAIYRFFPEIKREYDLYDVLKENATSNYKVLAKQLSYDEIQDFSNYMRDESTKGEIAGVWFEKNYRRDYPYGSLAADLIGFASSSNQGLVGVENKYNYTLNGINGRQYGYLNADSNLQKTVIQPTDGDTVVMTIDENIQAICEKYMIEWNDEHENGAHEGRGSLNSAVLVMNPNTGAVLAMASYPGFDLSNPWDLSEYYSEEEIAEMTEEDRMDALNAIWQNFCTTTTYEPGSTFKPVTLAAGLETGTIVGDEMYYCDGGEQIGPDHVHCVNVDGHGMQDIGLAMSNSCNDAFMQMSYAIGAENFAQYQNLFGFGLRTNIDLPGEARTDTLIYNRDQLSKINLATNSFGQNFNVTMVQLASAFCSVINGGYLYQPYVVQRIQDSNGTVVEETEPVLVRRTISRDTSDLIKDYLYQVVETGSAKSVQVEGYDIGGKTGTAQKHPRSLGNNLVSFIGYAPQEDPEVVIYVIVDEPNVWDQAHSTFAQGIAQKILTEILPYMNVRHSEGYEEPEVIALEDENAGEEGENSEAEAQPQ